MTIHPLVILGLSLMVCCMVALAILRWRSWLSAGLRRGWSLAGWLMAKLPRRRRKANG